MTKSIFFASRYLFASCFALTFSTPLLAATVSETTLMQGSIVQRSTTHATVYTSVLIEATPAQVWTTLTDFGAMADWSSSTLQGMTGDIQDDGSVVITFVFGEGENGDPIVNEIPHTLSYQEGVSFGWSDPFPAEIGGGHDNHVYRLKACGERTMFIQSDEIVDNPYAANFVSQLLPLYQLFNTELKTAVEN